MLNVASKCDCTWRSVARGTGSKVAARATDCHVDVIIASVLARERTYGLAVALAAGGRVPADIRGDLILVDVRKDSR